MAGEIQLSEGALATIMGGGDVKNAIMQVLESKKINSGAPDKERYRILISDGKFSINFAMLTTQINDKVGADGLQNNSVIKVKKYITSMINNVGRGDTRVLLILDMEIIAKGSEVGSIIGSPIKLTQDRAGSIPTPSSTTNGSSSTALSNGGGYGGPRIPSPARSSTSSYAPDTTFSSNQVISPISSLSPYHNKWVIKARVTNKSTIRTWSNSRGEGKLFSFDLLDESGEIRCTVFRDLVDKYYDYIQVDKVYCIGKCQLKPANKQFSTLKNDYEMTAANETVIQECSEAVDNVPQVKYDFTPIDKISDMAVGTLVDVIGVCKSVSDLQTLTARTTGRELKKKELTLVDASKSAIALTLWGADAESFEAVDNPIVVLKGAKIGEYGGGKNISTIMSSQLKINPDIPECHRLKGWYDTEGCQADISNLSARSGAGGMNTPWMTMRDARDQNLGQSERGDYYQARGVVVLIKSENAMYKACPTQECNKKVVDFENGMYRCEKCNKEYPNFKYRLLASVNVGDWTTNQWVSMFASEVEKIIGKTSQEVGEALENAQEDASKFFNVANFKSFIFKFRAKMETYNDEARLKIVAVNVAPIKYDEYNAHLVENIQMHLS